MVINNYLGFYRFLILLISSLFSLSLAINLVDAASLRRNAIKSKAVRDDAGNELLFVQAVWRHGERTPEHLIPTDTVNDEDSWPNGLGQLTTIGMVQQFFLGHKLRLRYIKEFGLISANYKSGEVYIRSSDSDRTLMSAASNMIGLYAADVDAQRVTRLEEETRARASVGGASMHGGVRTRNDTASYYPLVAGWPMSFVPVPVHTVPRDVDQLANVAARCPRRDRLDRIVENSREYLQLANETHDFFEELSKNCGENVTLKNIWRFEDVIFIEESANRTMPNWLTPEMRQRLFELDRAVTALYYAIYQQPTTNETKDGVDIHREIVRVRGGPLLTELVDNMRRRADCANSENTVRNQLMPEECSKINALKYYAYSMHDVTLRALYLSLGLHNVSGLDPTANPPYTTAFTLELWRAAQTDKYFVKLLHWPPDRTIEEGNFFDDITNRISGCNDTKCGLSAFTERSSSYKPEPDITTLCADEFSLLKSGSSSSKASSASIIFAIFSAFISSFT